MTTYCRPISPFRAALAWLAVAIVPSTVASADQTLDARIAGLIQELGNDNFNLREAASKALAEFEERAFPALNTAASQSEDPEIRHRASELATAMLPRVRAKALATVKRLQARIEQAQNRDGEPDEVTAVGFDGTNVVDEDLPYLIGLTELSTLVLTRTKVTDAGLRCLRKLNNLCNLSLSYTKISDAGIAGLKPLLRLESLDLSNTGITDEG
jgi:Leucine Rich repeat